MKKLVLLGFLSFASFCFSQKKEYDPKMVGCYKGSEANQQVDGVKKYWVSCRLDGGKSVLLFVAIDEDGQVKQTTENGNWWTENGKYYELHSYDNVTDIYSYKVLDNGDVAFKSIEMLGRPDTSYEFTDYKISE